ncbi:MAG: hypothetical protein AB7V77_03360 [Candidatus Woesearchaeota archaeon]
MEMEKTTEFTAEELSYAAHDKIDALIDVLIEKNIITEEEFVDSLKNIYKQIEEENKQ